jgi:hypothetical protein
VSSSEYADAVLKYVQDQGWTVNITELQEGACMIGGARETDSGPEDMLLMIICDPVTELEAKHLKYLIKTGREKNVDAVYVTYTVEITEAAKEIGRSHNIGVLPSEKIRAHSEAIEFDTDADESTPDPDSTTQDNPSQDSIPEEETEESEKHEVEADEREESAGETENLSTTGEIGEDRVDTQDSQSGHSNSEEPTEEATTETSPSNKQIEAKYLQTEGRSVVGKLTIEDRCLHFQPNSPDELSSDDELEIPYSKMMDVGIKNRFSGGIKNTLFGGGLRKRLKIETEDGDDFLFVVSNLNDTVADVENRIQEIKTTERTVDSDRIESGDTREGHSSGADMDSQRGSQTGFEIKRGAASAIILILIISGGAVLSSGLGNNSPNSGGDAGLSETVDQPATELLPIVDDFEDGWRGSAYTDGTAIFAAPDGNPVVTYNITVYNNSDEAQSALEAANPEKIATNSVNIGDNGYTYQTDDTKYKTVFRDRNVVCGTTYVVDREISTPESNVEGYAEKCLESIRR